MKVLIAVRVPGTDPHEVIQAHRRYLVQLMQQWTRIKDDEAGGALGLALAIDAELLHDPQLASWADRVVFLRDGRVTDQTAPAPGPESLLAPGDTR
jgi:hypothetical protein